MSAYRKGAQGVMHPDAPSVYIRAAGQPVARMAGSLANATSTRVDSASKHIIPCRVNTDYMASLVGQGVDNSMRELQINKMKYCMHKDDLVIGLGRPVYGASMNSSRKRAYPSVIVTLAGMDPIARRLIALQNFGVRQFGDISKFKEWAVVAVTKEISGEVVDAVMDESERGRSAPGREAVMKRAQEAVMKLAGLVVDPARKNRIAQQMDNLLEFYFVGVSLGTAYAHPHSGDTVASVMIGGLRTVLNGHFQVHTNDLLMFYWDDELPLFEEDGGRQNFGGESTLDAMYKFLLDGTWTAPAGKLTRSEGDRKSYYDRGNGNYPQKRGNVPEGKNNVARIKPYIVSRFPIQEGGTCSQHFPMDKMRVFGKAISNAQPFEMVDIMLSRQSI